MLEINKFYKNNNDVYFQYTPDVKSLVSDFGNDIVEVDINEFILNVAENIYIFGSQVYGTATKNSDVDMIVVFSNYNPIFDITPRYISTDNDIHFFTESEFQLKLDNMDIQMLESYFAPSNFKLKENIRFSFNYDEHKLRTSLSTISSNSYVKAKKKITVAGDYDLNCGLKSLFHSIRIVDFGLQIATNGKIVDFSKYNYILDDLYKLSKKYSTDELWLKIDTKYRKVFNNLSSQFKKVCRKRNDNIDFEYVNNLLKEYNVKEHHIHEIIKYFIQ